MTSHTSPAFNETVRRRVRAGLLGLGAPEQNAKSYRPLRNQKPYPETMSGLHGRRVVDRTRRTRDRDARGETDRRGTEQRPASTDGPTPHAPRRSETDRSRRRSNGTRISGQDTRAPPGPCAMDTPRTRHRTGRLHRATSTGTAPVTRHRTVASHDRDFIFTGQISSINTDRTVTSHLLYGTPRATTIP